MTKHGHTGQKYGHFSRTYGIWMGMIQRCTNPNATHYDYYGGRGIRVCDRWRDFANFLEDVGEIPQPYTLDRIDPNGDYKPGNWQLATRKQQTQNKRKHVMEGDRLESPLVVERPKLAATKHGGSETPEYQTWISIKNRCFNQNDRTYPRYGGRGITICERWLSFANFRDDLGPRPPDCRLSRQDLQMGFTPDNCRWATRSEISQHKRRRIHV